MRRSPLVRIGQLQPGDPRRSAADELSARVRESARSAFARSRDYPRDARDGYSDAVALGRNDSAADPSSPGAALASVNADLNPALVSGNVASSVTPPATPIFDDLRFADFANFGLGLTNASARILTAPPGGKRVYFFFVNTDAVDTLFIAFGKDADAANGIPIQPNFGFIEWAFVVPQNDIYCISNAAASTAVMVFANKGAPNLAGVSLRAPVLEQAMARAAAVPYVAAARELTYCERYPSAEGCRLPGFWGLHQAYPGGPILK
jgi:hypothetical protein